MKTQTAKQPRSFNLCIAALAVGLACSGCGRHAGGPTKSDVGRGAGEGDPLAWVLVPHEGEDRVDRDIRDCQAQLRSKVNPESALERLGWLFVAKARTSFDPAFYRRAEQCAMGLDSRRPGSTEAMLLRGHALQNQHCFKEAEPLARGLVAKRGLPFDYGLLGDVLMEQGRLAEATEAYQTMIDLRPDLQSYARGAHIRWLKGDLAGAVELMDLAAGAASPADPESAAWVNTRLAFYHLQKQAFEAAHRVCDTAVGFQKDYAPALLLRGRILLAEGETAAAIEPLERSAQLNPFPEYQWTLAEALRAEGRTSEAFAVEKQLRQTGAAADPRTVALFLATRSQQTQTALRLAERELDERGDVFTHDALAWSLQAAGRIEDACVHMEKALAEGTQDARLSFHAAVIAAKSGYLDEARRRFETTFEQMHLLLPSEQEQLQAAALAVDTDDLVDLAPDAGSASTHFSAPGAQLPRGAEE